MHTNSESGATGATPQRRQPHSHGGGPELPICREAGNSVRSLMRVPTAPHAHMKAFASDGSRDLRCRVADDPEKGTEQDRRPDRFSLHHPHHLLYSGHTASPVLAPAGSSLTSQGTAAAASPASHQPVCLSHPLSREGLCQAARCRVSRETAPEDRRHSASSVDMGPLFPGWLGATPTCLNPWPSALPMTVTAPRSPSLGGCFLLGELRLHGLL